MSNNTQLNSTFKTYVKEKNILIAEPNLRTQAFMLSLLESMGAPKQNIYTAVTIGDAKKQVEAKKPQIMICDYTLEGTGGLELAEMQKKYLNKNANKAFILTTENASQLAVARAAEEEVDGYILKPFTGGVLRDIILKTVYAKANPSTYDQAIEAGKALIAENKYQEALTTLENARTLHPIPALAFYYLGLLEAEQTHFKEAQEHFIRGLKVNRIHYKCMIGLYEVLMKEKLFGDAYAVLGRMARYYPPRSDRLTSMIKLAILTRNYEDIERVYRIFSGIENKNEELIKYMCAALVVCGKYYLQTHVKSRAIELFHQTLKTAGTNTKVLREIIQGLLDSELYKEASEFLTLFPASAKESPEYHAIAYSVFDKFGNAAETIDRGRELIQIGAISPTVYEILIKNLLRIADRKGAKELLETAQTKWPELQASFTKLMFTKEEEVTKEQPVLENT